MCRESIVAHLGLLWGSGRLLSQVVMVFRAWTGKKKFTFKLAYVSAGFLSSQAVPREVSPLTRGSSQHDHQLPLEKASNQENRGECHPTKTHKIFVTESWR